MSGIDLAASIIAIIGLCDQVISYSRNWISAVKDAPRDLQLIEIEVSSLKDMLGILKPLDDPPGILPSGVEEVRLRVSQYGLFDLCKSCMTDLHALLKPDLKHSKKLENGKRQKLEISLNALAWPLKQRKAHRLLQDAQSVREKISFALLHGLRQDLTNTAFGIQDVKITVEDLQRRLGIKDTDDLLQWISPLNASPRGSFEEAREKIWPGTGTWLLRSNEYARWTAHGGSFCLHGPSGSGKTVLSAAVIQDLQKRAMSGDDDRTCVLYYYFDNRDAARNTLASLYDSLIRQLLKYDTSGYGDVLDLATEIKLGQPTIGERQNLLQTLLYSAASDTTVYLVIDAWDECIDDFEQEKNGEFLKDVVAWLRPQPGVGDKRRDLRIFLTTNDYSWFQTMHLFDGDLEVDLSGPGPREKLNGDIKLYAQGKIASMGSAALSAMSETAESFQESVISAIVKNSGSLFIQAYHHVERIRSFETIDEIEKAIDNLPEQKDYIYREILVQLLQRYPGAKNHEILCKMFTWLSSASYCLTVREFVAMVTVSFTKAAPEEGDRICKRSRPWNPEAFCRRLGGFLRIDPGPNEINFPHSTIEEYLRGPSLENDTDERLRKLHVSEIESQQSLAQTCATFMGCIDFNRPLSSTVPDLRNTNPPKHLPGGLGLPLDPETDAWIGPMQERLASYPGLEYTSINLLDHIRKAANFDGEWVRETIVPVFGWFLNASNEQQTSNGRYKSWQEAHSYFCCEPKCDCDRWQPPRYFLRRYRLEFLLGHTIDGGSLAARVKAMQNDSTYGSGASSRGEPYNTAPLNCPGCGISLPIRDETISEPGTDNGHDISSKVQTLCMSCGKRVIEGMKSNCTHRSKCGRTYKLFQTPEFMWKTRQDAEPYLLKEHGVTKRPLDD